MRTEHVVIIGGGLAGLAVGCYARASGLRTTLVEHNLALGGVCTAWSRGAYTIDGGIRWLAGGPFDRIYEELGILPDVPRRALTELATYRHAGDGLEIRVTDDLEALARTLDRLAPADHAEIQRVVAAAKHLSSFEPDVLSPELPSVRDSLTLLFETKPELRDAQAFQLPIGQWVETALASPRLRRFFTAFLPANAPMSSLLLLLGFLSRGYLSRPEGGSARIRDALAATYQALGGVVQLHATVDEVLVDSGRAIGVRLADGGFIDADHVISTASLPETVLRLLGGRYGAEETRYRLDRWALYDPIVLATFGVAATFPSAPSVLLVDGTQPVDIGGRTNTLLDVRVFNDDRAMAPAGHTVVQVKALTDYAWWARRGSSYTAEKDLAAEVLLSALDRHLPGVRQAARLADVATPLTFWNMARSWRGAYEGWMPPFATGLRGPAAARGVPTLVRKTLPGLDRFHVAGQWVEPGGGVPSALMSGRHVVSRLCEERGVPFKAPAAHLAH